MGKQHYEAGSPRQLYNGIRIPADRTLFYDADSGKAETPPYLLSPKDGGYAPDVVSVDIGRQLFVDDFLIENSEGLERIFYSAQKSAQNPIFSPETEWELTAHPSTACTSGGIWYDKDEGIYKMWYEAGFNNRLAYATSSDGIHWERPSLNEDGSNLLLREMRTDSFSIWIDYDAPAEERYKLMNRSPNTTGHYKFPAEMFVSADGVHWNSLGPTGIMKDRSTFFYNPFLKKWIFSIRATADVRWHEERYIPRLRFYHDGETFAESGRWGDDEPPLWLKADDDDQKDLTVSQEIPELYNFDSIAYESVMLGFFQMWFGPHNDDIAKTRRPKITELQMGFSRDGFHYHRPNRQAFIAAGREYGKWDYGYLQSPTGGVIVYDDEIRIYYSGLSGQYRVGDREWIGAYLGGAVGYATLRRDGFASMSGTGELTTKPLTFYKNARYLFVNAKATGNLRAELSDANGAPIEGYTAEDCDPFIGDSTKIMLRWKDGATLPDLKSIPFRIRFLLESTDLFAFWLSPTEEGASDGAMAAGYVGKN